MEGTPIEGTSADEQVVATAGQEALPEATPESAQVAINDTGTGAEASAESAGDEGASDEDADLLSYPEDVREEFRSLAPATRKRLYEHAEANAREGMEAVRKRESEAAERELALAAEVAKREDDAKAVLAELNEFVGAAPTKVKGRDGVERDLPAYEDIARLNQTRTGRDTLWNQYGLDEDGVEEQLQTWSRNDEMLRKSSKFFDDQAWGNLDRSLQEGIKAAGYEPGEILSKADSPQSVIVQLVSRLKAEHEAEKKSLVAEHEAREAAHTSNAEALRGRAVAGSTRQPASGGRTTGGSSDVLTPEAYAAMPFEERVKLRSTPEGRARIDAMTSGSRR